MQPIALRKMLTLLLPACSSLCLATGFQRSGLAAAASVGLIAWLAWLAVRHWPTAWTAGPVLVVSLVVSVFGVTTSGIAPWLIASAALALASWDLILLDAFLADASLAGIPPTAQTARLEKAHYRALALALGAGLLLSLLGRLVQLRLPFLLILLLVALAFFSLDRLLRAMRKEFHV